jgi:hypothetical protein
MTKQVFKMAFYAGNEKEQDTPLKKQDGAKTDSESLDEKLPYPKSVFLIIATEFCERFSYYGMRSKSQSNVATCLMWQQSNLNGEKQSFKKQSIH